MEREKPESFLRYAQIEGNKQERDNISTTTELKDHFTVAEMAEGGDSCPSESPGTDESEKECKLYLKECWKL